MRVWQRIGPQKLPQGNQGPKTSTVQIFPFSRSFSLIPAAEIAAAAREMLDQFTEAATSDQGCTYVGKFMLYPFVMNGQARGYDLQEVEDRVAHRWEMCGLKTCFDNNNTRSGIQ
jgi:hypothetical protein